MGDRDVRALPVPEALDGTRLDLVISRLFGLSRTAAAAVVEAGDALLEGAVGRKSDPVRAGVWLEVTLPPPPTEPVATESSTAPEGLRILYADEHLVAVDKPVGVAAHASPGWRGPTVPAGLAAMGQTVATSGAAERQGIVHRLDVGTTGVMVVAKSEQAYRVLKDAFRQRQVDKRYHAVVQGRLDPLQGTIDAPIGRHPRHDWRWAVVSGGRDSVTHYETLEAFRAASLVDVLLETGRTHQIRVHFAAMRHPCVGDMTYGADPALAQQLGLTRQWLHARELSFAHPHTGEPMQVVSDYPADLAEALAKLRAAA